MSKQKENFFQFFTLLAMAMTRQVADFKYKNIKIGSLIFVISYIGYKNGCTMTDVISYLNLKASTATRQMDILVNKLKLVIREHSTEDRRVINLTLTDLGQEVYKYHKNLGEVITNMLLTKFNEKEIATLLKAMDELNKLLSLNI